MCHKQNERNSKARVVSEQFVQHFLWKTVRQISNSNSNIACSWSYYFSIIVISSWKLTANEINNAYDNFNWVDGHGNPSIIWDARNGKCALCEHSSTAATTIYGAIFVILIWKNFKDATHSLSIVLIKKMPRPIFT